MDHVEFVVWTLKDFHSQGEVTRIRLLGGDDETTPAGTSRFLILECQKLRFSSKGKYFFSFCCDCLLGVMMCGPCGICSLDPGRLPLERRSPQDPSSRW